MIRILQRSLSVLVCILLISFVSFAQETPDPKTPKEDPKPKEQPLDKPTEVKEAPKKQDPALADKKPDVTVSVAGGTAAGQSPEASPESKLANRFQDIPVNLFLGTPIIGFPIYNLTEAGGASIPLGFSYNATGMKGHDVASWCGMNWSFNQIQILRIVRGLPDEGKFALNNGFSATARKGSFQFGLKADNDIENDGQPDLFFLNINGTSYKFSFDANKKAHFFPEADIDVQVNWMARTLIDDVNTLSSVGDLTNWIITMPDGTKYFFDGPSAYEASFELEAEQAKNLPYVEIDIYAKVERVVSTYYVTKIETAFGHQTLFEYRNTNYSYFRIAEQEATTINCTFTGIGKKINRVYVYSSVLYKISNGTHVVEFNKGGWTLGINYFGKPYWYLNSTYPSRKDVDVFQQFTKDSSETRALHKISVYAKDDPTKLFEWKFKYDYNTGADQSTTPLGYSYSTIGRTHQKRFKLRSIEEPDGNKYTFKYYDDGFPSYSRFTQGIDHWGYPNGILGVNTMIGEDAFRVCVNNQFSDRSATTGWSQYGTLTAISHSTGGSTILEYENNTARNYANIIGGSRIKKITYVDSVSNLKTGKKYEYKQVDGKSSGYLCLKPVYHFDDKINYQGARNQFWFSGLYQQLLSESGRPAVGYSRVKETIISGDESDSLGYTISEFLQPLTEINLTERVTYNCVTQYPPEVPYEITTCDTSRYLRPWKWNPYHENTVGVPSRVAVYGKANQLLSEKKNVYTEQQLQANSFPFQENYRSFRLVGENYNFERNYFETFTTFRLTSDTTKVYSQDGTNPLVSYGSQQYPLAAKHNQVIKTSTTDSYGNIVENFSKFAPDFNFTFSLLGTTVIVNPSNSEAKGILALKQKHIFNAPIENITRRKSYFGNTFVVNASYQSYYGADSVGVKAGMLKSSFGLENVPRPSLAEVSYTPNPDAFVRSSDYDLKATIEAYTSIGLPKQSNTRFATQSKVNYDATYPTLPISQVSNVGLATEQTTSTEYAKILYGVSKQTGVNGLSVSNEYYADGKLKQQTDKDGKVLKHIQYVYRGQADADPLLNTNTGYNRIITRIPRIATTTPLTLTHTDCAISVTYMDGSGRVVENIGYRASPNEKDMVSGVVEYDKFNRPIKSWLAVESTQNTGGLLDTATVKSIAQTFYKDTKPYTEVLEYEASPLSRVFKSYGVGKVWRDSLKYVQGRYETATGIKRLLLAYNDNIAYIGTYLTYELSKMTSTDERGNKVIEYKDRAGNTIQRDVQVDATNYLSTYHIFDDAGRLRYTLNPKAYNALPSNTTLDVEAWSQFNENVYALHYDGRFRVYESHKPGIGWIRTVFNRLNQAVLSQDDDELAKNNTWNYVQTDGQGRSVRDGQMILPTNFNRTYLQNLFDNFIDTKQFEERSTATGNVQQYTNQSFPTALRAYINDATAKNVHYYDNSLWVYSDPNSGPAIAYAFQSNPYNSTAYSNTNATGLSTGGLYKVDNFGDFWFPFTVFSDDKNRTIQTITYQDLYARNQSDVQYNFVGEALQNRMIYRKSGASDNIITTEKIIDHVGRTKDMYYNLVEGTIQKVPRFRMSSMIYDNIGRVKTKLIAPNNSISSVQTGFWSNASTWYNGMVPNTTIPAVISQGHTVTVQAGATVTAGTLYNAGTLQFLNNSRLQLGSMLPVRGAALQVMDYSYNVSGKIRGVNLDANDNPQVSSEKLFSYKIDHHEDGRYFDGSISKMTWKAQNSPQNRSYLYSYDKANRVLNSQYSGVGTENYSVSNSYDVNGNITNLQRYGKTGTNTFGLIDNLTYSYLSSGNKLQKVEDAVSGNAYANDFRDVTGNDYTYSTDGKLTKDGNKSISLIDYNFLDLISKVKFSSGDSIVYYYTSTGTRRQKVVTKSGVKTYTLYDGEMVYTFTGVNTSLNDFKVAEIQNSEGRYVNGKLEYGYIDHIGNLRLSYKDSLGVAFITQSQSYDTWSNVLAGTEYSLNANSKDPYLVCGKEFQNETSFTSLDWREYDSVLGRMHTYDPEDQSQMLSGYVYCGNNPVSQIDPDGRFAFMPFLMMTLISGHIGGMISQGNGGSYGKGFLTGAASSIITAGIGSGVGAVFGNATTLGGFAFRGALAGGLSGGTNSVLNRENFMNGFKTGAIIGGALGIADGLLSRNDYSGLEGNGGREPEFYTDARQQSPNTVQNPFEGNAYDISKPIPFNDYEAGFLANNVGGNGGINAETGGGAMWTQMNGIVRASKNFKGEYSANASVFGITNQEDATWFARGRMNISGSQGEWQTFKLDSHGYLGTPMNYKTLGSASFKLPKYGSANLEISAGVKFYSSGGAAIPIIRDLNAIINLPILKRGGLFPFIRKP